MDFITCAIYAISFIGVGEGLNCMYPRLDEYYDSEGMVCQWKEEDFDLIKGEYILKKEDPEDNCFEARARKRYWKDISQ
jgi:hypothetical protein